MLGRRTRVDMEPDMLNLLLSSEIRLNQIKSALITDGFAAAERERDENPLVTLDHYRLALVLVWCTAEGGLPRYVDILMS